MHKLMMDQSELTQTILVKLWMRKLN